MCLGLSPRLYSCPFPSETGVPLLKFAKTDAPLPSYPRTSDGGRECLDKVGPTGLVHEIHQTGWSCGQGSCNRAPRSKSCLTRISVSRAEEGCSELQLLA